MKLAGTWIFIHQLCSAGTSGWISAASRETVYHIRKATAAVMTVSLGKPVYGAISVVVLVLATMDYFLPPRDVIDADGAAWKQLVWRRRRWTTFRRFVRHADGIFLSPFRHQSRLDSFRGVFLRFGDGVCADDVDALVRFHVAD